MFEKIEVLNMSAAKAGHAALRQAAIAENVANADTPGYRAKDIASFSDTYRSADSSLRSTRRGHIGAATGHPDLLGRDRTALGAASPNGNSVSLEVEMMKAAEVRHEHDLALSIYQKSIGVLRASLGRA